MEKLKIENFKCFQDADITLNSLTVLVGGNGFGKSSVIQALLILREALIQHHSGNTKLKLNGPFGLTLGISSGIMNQTTQNPHIQIALYDAQDDSSRRIKISFVIHPIEDELYISFDSKQCEIQDSSSPLQQTEFYYLTAERTGPRIVNNLEATPFTHVGYYGELTAQVLSERAGFTKIPESRGYKGVKDMNLSRQVNAWLNSIIPGVAVAASSDPKTLTAKILVENPLTKSERILSTNIGFGISYVLPIIVTGLIAKENTYFIIENPEAHLHPAAQSAIGYFLAMVAAQRIRVVVETHSDHVLNGIQLYVSEHPEFAQNTTVNFFSLASTDDQPNIHPISIKSDGMLTDWPKGFFDQTLIDYSKLSHLHCD